MQITVSVFSRNKAKRIFFSECWCSVLTVLCSRWRQAWPTLREWTTSTETCAPPTFWWETTWCARSLISAWRGSSKTMNTLLGKVGAPCSSHTHTHYIKYTFLMFPLTHICTLVLGHGGNSLCGATKFTLHPHQNDQKIVSKKVRVSSKYLFTVALKQRADTVLGSGH